MRAAVGTAICLAFCVLQVSSENTKLKDVFSWNFVDYEWMKPEDRAAAVEKKEYIPENNLPLGLEVWKNKLFITVPRWKSGVVSTLNYVKIDDATLQAAEMSSEDNTRSPALIPYPSLEANRLDPEKKDGNSITSVFRVRADACDRLWVMDTGLADLLGETIVVSKPRIHIYNLTDDTIIRTYELKDTDSKADSFYANIVVDADDTNCDNAFAYIPDLGGYGIVVYDYANNDSWRIKHNYFHFDPLGGNMTVGGVNFQWTDGVFSIALSKRNEAGSRTAYFHALASTKEFRVDTKTLQTKDTSKIGYNDFQLVGDRGECSQSSASFIEEDSGVMFYTQLQKDGVYCWNTNKDLVLDNLVEIASDNETMIFTNDLKVDPQGRLWVLTDRLPTFIYRGLSNDDVNYHIFTAPVKDIIKGTKCDV